MELKSTMGPFEELIVWANLTCCKQMAISIFSRLEYMSGYYIYHIVNEQNMYNMYRPTNAVVVIVIM